jgi:hypothetical protein
VKTSGARHTEARPYPNKLVGCGMLETKKIGEPDAGSADF